MSANVVHDVALAVAFNLHVVLLISLWITQSDAQSLDVLSGDEQWNVSFESIHSEKLDEFSEFYWKQKVFLTFINLWVAELKPVGGFPCLDQLSETERKILDVVFDPINVGTGLLTSGVHYGMTSS